MVMETGKVLLSIGIPTYNRARRLQRQLSFLYEELNSLSSEEKKLISISIRDNCSSDNTREIVSKSPLLTTIDVNSSFTINSQNLGLSGNLKKLYTTLNGLYIWIIGDDDDLKKGIVRRVLAECKKRSYSYVFINHIITKNSSEIHHSVLADLDVTRTDKTVLWDLYKQSGTVMMLISACVYRSDLVRDYLSHYDVDLVIPCSLSFYCASKGSTKLIEDTYITNDQTVISWKKSIVKVFYTLIPSMLLRMSKWGYNRRDCLNEYFKLKKSYLRPKIKELFHKI